MTTAEHIIGMSLDEFIREYSESGPFELIDGERVPLSPTVSLHTLIIHRLFRPLDAWCTQHGTAQVFIEAPFALSETADWVKGSRVPDLMVINQERLSAFLAKEGWEGKPFLIVPDLVVEIVSPTDRPGTVLGKVARYLADGVRLVWVIYAEQRSVTVYSADRIEPRVLSRLDTLDGEAILPGFSLPVSALFG